MKLKLYKKINNRLELVDFGVFKHYEKYEKMGYVVKEAKWNDTQRLYHVVKAEFDKLWYTLPAEEKRRLADIPRDWEMSIEEKLSIVKAEVSVRKKRSITVVHHRRVSFMSKVKSFFNSLIPQMEVCYA